MNYSSLSKGMQEGFRKFGYIYQLPVVRSPYDYLRRLYRSGYILDVGAGVDLYIKNILHLDENTYFSLDNDPSGTFSYHQTSDIPQEMQFEWIIINELIEHLTIEQGVELLTGLRNFLHRDGQAIITTPNILHPIRFWSNPTHVTPWSYNALYGLLTSLGYQVPQIYRYSKNHRPLDPLSWLVERLMRRIYRVDWCDSIMVIATR
jgi:2-polyprenyl-3-methyl-5-hydroxy-6-metoxy-1,4-benzoquinol methylase